MIPSFTYKIFILSCYFHCLVTKSCPSLWPHGLQHTRLLCPPLSPGVCSNLWPSSQWCHPTISSSVALFFSCPQSFPASGSFPMSRLWVRWPEYWSFSFSISPSSEYSGLISFRIDWFHLLVIQGTLKSLLQNYSLKASILWRSAFFTVQQIGRASCRERVLCVV